MNSFNYSAISLSRRCNKLFQYVYVDKLKSDVAPSGDMAWGTAIHLGVETYLAGDNGSRVFETFWNIEKTRNNRYGRFKWDELKDQGLRILDRFERLHLKKFEIFQMEERLYGEFEGIKLEGTPDFIGKFEGVESVLDFKTAGSRYHAEKGKTAEQLYLYAYLAESVLKYPVKQIVYFVFIKGSTPSIQTPVIHKFTQKECTKILQDLKEECKQLLWKQENNIFTRNRNNCIIGDVKCDHWSRCYSKE